MSRPGHAPRTITFDCAPITDRVPTVTAHLDATIDCFGAVAVALSSVHGGGRVTLPGELRFSGELELPIPLRDVVDTGSACLPCGRYMVDFDSLSNGARSTLGPIEVAAGRTARIELADVGALRIRVARPNGDSFRGHLPIHIARQSGSSGAANGHRHIDLWVPTRRDEYWIAGLRPGIYSLSINGPFLPVALAAHDARGWIGPLVVHAGETADLQLELGR